MQNHKKTQLKRRHFARPLCGASARASLPISLSTTRMSIRDDDDGGGHPLAAAWAVSEANRDEKKTRSTLFSKPMARRSLVSPPLFSSSHARYRPRFPIHMTRTGSQVHANHGLSCPGRRAIGPRSARCARRRQRRRQTNRRRRRPPPAPRRLAPPLAVPLPAARELRRERRGEKELSLLGEEEQGQQRERERKLPLLPPGRREERPRRGLGRPEAQRGGARPELRGGSRGARGEGGWGPRVPSGRGGRGPAGRGPAGRGGRARPWCRCWCRGGGRRRGTRRKRGRRRKPRRRHRRLSPPRTLAGLRGPRLARRRGRRVRAPGEDAPGSRLGGRREEGGGGSGRTRYRRCSLGFSFFSFPFLSASPSRGLPLVFARSPPQLRAFLGAFALRGREGRRGGSGGGEGGSEEEEEEGE